VASWARSIQSHADAVSIIVNNNNLDGPFLKEAADTATSLSKTSLSFEESKEVKSGLKQLSSFTANVLQQQF